MAYIDGKEILFSAVIHDGGVQMYKHTITGQIGNDGCYIYGPVYIVNDSPTPIDETCNDEIIKGKLNAAAALWGAEIPEQTIYNSGSEVGTQPYVEKAFSIPYDTTGRGMGWSYYDTVEML